MLAKAMSMFQTEIKARIVGMKDASAHQRGLHFEELQKIVGAGLKDRD